MKISIIIPNYNNGIYIERCLNSVFNQNYKNIEVIIIDDGSTDNSVQIINDIITKYAYKDIKFINQFNQNAAIARNRGIEIATGDYLYFIDSDDEIYDTTTLEELANEMKDYDLVIGNYTIIDANENITDEYDNSDDIEKLNGNYKYCKLSPVPSNKLYRKSVVDENNIYFSNVKIGQDLNFYLKYLLVSKKIKLIKNKVYKYRIVDNSMSRVKNLNFLDIYNSVDGIKKFYYEKNHIEDYYKYISPIAIKHYRMEMSKVSKFKNHKERAMIFEFFSYCVSNSKVDKIYRTEFYYKEYKKYIIKELLLKLKLDKILHFNK